MLELLLFEIAIKKKNGIEKVEKEREGMFKSYFLDLLLYKTPSPFFFPFVQ
jgi:hypothetical protein